jgi:F-type H+-transporting ATPase subunit alpha
MKKIAGRLRVDLAQYRELEAFAAFGSDLDAASKAQLARGSRLVELLKQPQYSPFPVEREVVSIWAGTQGKLDDVPVEDVRRFEAEFLDYVARDKPGIYAAILESRDLSEDTTSELDAAIGAFKKQFTTSEGNLLVKDEPVAPLGPGDVQHDGVRRHVRTEDQVKNAAGPIGRDAGSSITPG